jgi:hypothetical protein
MRLHLVRDQELPQSAAYEDEVVARAFWRSSYRTGRDYSKSRDATGGPMLWAHERELADGYTRRLKTTKPRNHAGPIIRRYNDFVFRTPATRADAEGDGGGDPLYATLVDDVDGRGTSLDRFMREALQVAQVDREAYLLPDSTKPADAGQLTVAQAKAKGVRPIARRIDADAVPWWVIREGVLVEAVVLLEREDGTAFARWYGPATQMDIELTQPKSPGEWYRVTSWGGETPHKYGACPLVPLAPMFDTVANQRGESQIHPLAESQQAIYNYLSLLNEELFNVVFSQVIATGVSATDVKNTSFGSARLLCLPNPQAKFDVLGADPDQATSIRTSIADEERELYRMAGIATGDPMASPGDAESGVAKAFRFNDLAANLSALADACQTAENALMDRIYSAQGKTKPGPAQYPQEFDLPVMADELSDIIRAISVQQIPDVIKKHMVRRFADRSLGLSDDEDAELESELAAFKTPDPTSAFPGAAAGS